MIKIQIKIKRQEQFRTPIITMQERYNIRVYQSVVHDKKDRVFHVIKFKGELNSFIKYEEFTRELERHINY